MLGMVWRKWNPLTLLVGMQTDTTTMENSVEISLKTRDNTTTWLRDPTPRKIPWRNQNWKYTCTTMFTETLFTIIRTWKQPRCPLTDEWMRKFLYIYTMECSVQSLGVSDSLRPHELQHARPPCPSATPGVHPNPCPLSQWCHPIISSSVIPFSSCPQSFPASGLFQWVSSLGQMAKVLVFLFQYQSFQWTPRDWSPLGWTGWIFLQYKGLSRVLSNITVQKH